MDSLKSKETTARKSSPGSPRRDERQNSPAAEIPGPGRWETLRRLYPVPFRKFPGFLTDITERYGAIAAFSLPWRDFVIVNDPELIVQPAFHRDCIEHYASQMRERAQEWTQAHKPMRYAMRCKMRWKRIPTRSGRWGCCCDGSRF